MGRQKWGAAVCLDCREEAHGLCPTCAQARYDIAKAKRDENRETIREVQRERRAYLKMLEERRYAP